MKLASYQKGEKNKMNNNSNRSKTLVNNIAKILENIEIDDTDVQQTITDIKNTSNQLNKFKENYKNESVKNNEKQ